MNTQNEQGKNGDTQEKYNCKREKIK